jgi:hypothetical protein
MYTKIWIPGTDIELDRLFEELRQNQHNDVTHPLYNNYSAKAFEECSALSITFDNDQPIVVGSILTRSCWPKNAYRIVNRFWKVHEHRLPHLDRNHGMTVFSKTVEAHVNYTKQHLNAEIIFISRQYNNWQKFVVKQIKLHTGLEFEYDSYKYLTCSNLDDCSCWQPIMYLGNTKLLNQWSRK